MKLSRQVSRLAMLLGAGAYAQAGIAADCKAPLQCAAGPEPACIAPDRRAISKRISPRDDFSISQDNVRLLENGDMAYVGNVEVRQGERVLRAQEIDYSEVNQDIRVPGPVELSDPSLIVRGQAAKADTDGAAQVDKAEFELPARAGHGSAEQIQLSADGIVDLRDVRYTTCPLPRPSWELKVDKLHIDQQARVGTGTGARVEFKGVPILYTPYISFPVGNEPKTGLLFPEFGQSSRSGWQLALPWYWRIAPNYDATFTPTYFSSRGLDIGTEFRYLNERNKGRINFDYLPGDRQTHDDRTHVELIDQTDFTSRLRFSADAINLGDNAWYEDFGGATYTNIVALPRIGRLEYRGDEWSLAALAQNFQIIDPQIARIDRPYTILPQLQLRGFFPDRLWGVTAAIYGEAAAFQRNPNLGQDDRVQRLDVQPQLRLPLRTNGVFLEPVAEYRYVGYHVDNPSSGDSNPSIAVPELSIDSGMVFERQTGGQGRRMQTLEPRVLYAYVPYRNQDTFPVVDTRPPDFNLIQLFEIDRYAGTDRVGDVNHVAFGVTSRLIDNADGRQFLSATIGQQYRFAPQRVVLPGESPEDRGSSDIIGELNLTAYRNWSAHLALQWDPASQRNERTEVAFQFRPDGERVVNLGYRYRRSDVLSPLATASQPSPEGLEQIDASAAWPIGSSWSLYGRVIYSIKDEAAIDRFVGFEYRSCCWGARVLARRYVSTITGESGWDYKAQLELNGLANVGHPVDTFLTESIRGYSAARNDYRSTP